MKKFITTYVSSVIFMAGLYSLLVASLFFTYGKKIEQDVVKKNTELLIDDLSKDIVDLANQSEKQDLDNLLKKNVKIPQSIKDADKTVEDRNKKLMIKAFKNIGLFALICVITSFILWGFSGNSYKEFKIDIVYKTLLFLFIIALVEIAFFTIITKNFRSLDPSVIKHNIVKSMQKRFSKKE
jgi:hypothetical protein